MSESEIAFGPGEEFRIVRRFIRRLGTAASGIGDDGTLAHIPRDNALVVSVDSSIDRVHFRRDWITDEEIGYRAATAALSDLAAMGAAPTGILVALTVTSSAREMLDGFADGIARAVTLVGTKVIGGDTTRGAVLSMSFTVVGHAREPMTRTAARADHRVYLTGRLGGPAAAVRAWEAGDEPRAEWRDRFASPFARIREGRWLAGQGARAAIDISDGLAADISHVAAASNVRITIDLDRVPRVPGVDVIAAARGGEEYELVVTSAIPLDAEAFESRFGVPLTEIGVVRDGAPGAEFVSAGKPVDIDLTGYDHFAS